MGKQKESRLERVLGTFCNIYGFPLTSDSKRSIKQYLANPTPQNWHNIHAIVIWNAPVINIWTQACHCNPHVDVTGRKYEQDAQGNWMQVSEWNVVPSPIELVNSLEKFFDDDDDKKKETIKNKLTRRNR